MSTREPVAELGAVYEHLRSHHRAHIALIQELVRQPSISLENNGLPECAQLVCDHLKLIGCDDASVIDVGDQYPGVWGHIDSAAPKTLWCYSHYDVRPVGHEPWTHAPFDADIAEFANFKSVIVGRGAVASKGPLQAWLNAIESIRTVVGRLPVNVSFLVEGAEILGSPNYPRLVESRSQELRSATALYSPGVSQDRAGVVSVVLGYKGLVYLEIEASSGNWGRGPQGGAVHSATNAIVDNPAWRLVHALSTLTDGDGRLIVPGLAEIYDERKPVASWELQLLDSLRQQVGAADWNSVIPGLSTQYPVKTFKNNLSGSEILEEYLYAPSANISGLRSGYTGPGTKSFLLPHEARATLEIRMITSHEAGDLVGLLRHHLDRQGFADVGINVFSAYNWNQTSPSTDLVRSALETLSSHGCDVVIWPMVAYGGPWAHIPKSLGIPALLGGAPGYGARAATSDEFLVIEGDGVVADLKQLERYFVDFLYAYAKATDPKVEQKTRAVLGEP
jgi:acetylornithine deacetylase/succinyl-diaminopimelate desuccinylase-like protein